MTIPAEALRAVEPRQATAWMRANGWDLVGTRPEHTATWKKSAGAEGEYIIDLPLDPTFRDYARRIAEIIDTLSVASGKPAGWVLAEVQLSTDPLHATVPVLGAPRVTVGQEVPMIDTRLNLSPQGTDVHDVAAWIADVQATVDASSKPVDMSLGDLITVAGYAALAAPVGDDPMTPAEAQAWFVAHVMASLGAPMYGDHTVTVASVLPYLRALLAMDCPDDLANMLRSNLP